MWERGRTRLLVPRADRPTRKSNLRRILYRRDHPHPGRGGGYRVGDPDHGRPRPKPSTGQQNTRKPSCVVLARRSRRRGPRCWDSFLFVILILLAFFATQFKPEETVPRDEYETLKNESFEACKRIRRLEEALIAARRHIDGSEKEQRKLAGRSEATEVERDAARECEGSLTTLMREIAWLRNRIKELEAPDPLVVYLEGVSSARATLLERLAKRIRQQLPGIRVTVVAADGVIRFRGDDLFKSGRWRVRPGSTADRVSRAVGDALADTLPCYTVGRRAAFKASRT